MFSLKSDAPNLDINCGSVSIVALLVIAGRFLTQVNNNMDNKQGETKIKLQFHGTFAAL